MQNYHRRGTIHFVSATAICTLLPATEWKSPLVLSHICIQLYFFLFLAVLGLHCCLGFPLFVDLGLSSKQARWLWHTSFVALRHMESSPTRDGTHVPYTCRQVLHPEHQGSPSCQLLQRPRQCPFPLHRMQRRSRDSPGWTKSGTTQLGSDPNPTVHKLCDISKWLSLSGLAFLSQR